MAFIAGYIPLQRRKTLILSEAHEQEQATPRVEVVDGKKGLEADRISLI